MRDPAAIREIAKEIVGRTNNRTLVVIGSQKTAANSPMSGYIRTPQTMLLRAIKELPRVDVIEFYEFRSTMLCSDCFSPLKTSRSPDRYQFWKNCRKVWNRDITGDKNILQNGLFHHIAPCGNFENRVISKCSVAITTES